MKGAMVDYKIYLEHAGRGGGMSMELPRGDINKTGHLNKESRQVQRSGNERRESSRVIPYTLPLESKPW